MKNRMKNRNQLNPVLRLLALTLVASNTCVQADDPKPKIEATTGSTVPRDKISAEDVTFNIKQSGVAVAGATVTFTVTSNAKLSAAFGTTDSNGNVTVSVSSIDIKATDATATVTASYSGESTTKDVTLKGLTATLITQYTKVYGNGSTYQPSSKLTCTVMGGSEPAQGKIKFETNGGTYTDGTTIDLSSSGVEINHLKAGLSAGFKDKPVAVVVDSNNQVKSTVDVEIVTIAEADISGAPHKKVSTTDQVQASAALGGTDVLPFCFYKIHLASSFECRGY